MDNEELDETKTGEEAPAKKQEPESYEFDLVLKEKPVRLKRPDGTVKTLTLRELDGPGRDDYAKFMQSRTKFGPDGRPVGVRSLEGVEDELLTKSLFDETGKALTKKDILELKLPGRVKASLFKAALNISALDEESQEEAKKP